MTPCRIGVANKPQMCIRDSSYANAVEFSTQQAQRLGWDSYGDTQYPAHVLRYYPYGRAFTAGGNRAIVEVCAGALLQLRGQDEIHRRGHPLRPAFTGG